jgi:hypothetical protein
MGSVPLGDNPPIKTQQLLWALLALAHISSDCLFCFENGRNLNTKRRTKRSEGIRVPKCLWAGRGGKIDLLPKMSGPDDILLHHHHFSSLCRCIPLGMRLTSQSNAPKIHAACHRDVHCLLERCCASCQRLEALFLHPMSGR